MKTKTWVLGIGALALLIVSLYSIFSDGQGAESKDINPGFRQYVSAYTYGTISKKSTLIIEFVDDVAEVNSIGKEESSPLVELEPAVYGKIKWINARTLEFIPDELMESATEYTLTLAIDQIIPSIPDSLGEFSYQFSTKRQWITVDFESIQNISDNSIDLQRLSGELVTEDFELGTKIEELFAAKLEGENISVSWQHSADGRSHQFLIDSISRQNFGQELMVSWDGSMLNSEAKGERKFDILAIGDFQFLSAAVENGADQYVSFTFSDPVDPKQDLQGLIRIGDYGLTFVTEGNIIKAYPNVRLIGDVTVKVEAGVRNIIGHQIQKPSSYSVNFIEIKPQLKLRGKGIIIPASSNMPFLFEAVNLSAVDVRVIKIFEKSVPQFLQVNELNGSRELRRVGHVIANKKIDLTANPEIDLKSWNVHSLDLGNIIKAEAGAIYEIAIGFRRSYSLYTCSDTTAVGDSDNMLALGSGWAAPEEEKEASYWDYYEPQEEENYWEDRENPCKNAYYSSNKSIKRNVLASTIGLTAKMGESDEIFVAVTDINTTKPLANIILEIYNYQQHLIQKKLTDANGVATLKVNETPYLLIAKRGQQRGYLRMDDGRSLSVSRFDIGGVVHKEGLKGFIYGERGVWRPGDSLFLNFILNDKEKPIPANHPIVFELSNPSGQLVKRIVRKENVNGFYTFHTATKEDAPTGTYLARIRVGGVSFTKNVKIETIVPNRLKLKLDFDLDYLSSETTDHESELQVNWLHGAVGKNLKATVEATLVQGKTSFKKYGEFVFDDPSRSFSSERKMLFEGNLNEEGKAMIVADMVANEEAPGMLRANFVGKAFEPGGNFSVDRFSLPYSPYQTYVGIKTPKGDKSRGIILTDTNHMVKVVSLNADGEKVSNKKVHLSLYKLDWKWWWDKTAYKVNYNGRYFNKALKEDTVTTKNGEADWTLRLNYPEWGRYIVRACDEGGHCAAKVIYMDWPGWAGRGSKEKNAGSSMLSFTADKKSYDVGDDIVLNIPTGAEGRALLTIENGNKVVQSFWINAKKGTTRYAFKATAQMVPNVYAHISLIQPHEQTKNDLPIRMYGVIPIMVKDPRTVLKPVIKMPDVLEPESKVTIEVKEENSSPMTYTLAIVDEGLLDLTRFKTPRPWSYFYQRQALRVKTWDLFDHVLGAEASKVNSLLSIGGDGDLGANKGGKKQNRFKPVVKFLGPFTLNPGASNKHNVQIPNYIGSVKTMVVAGYNGAYGHASKATAVKKPLMVLGSLPRQISPEESISMPVTIFAMEDHIKEVEVSVELSDLLTLEGEKTQKITFNEVGEGLLNFDFKVKQNIGEASIKIIAKSGKEQAIYNVNVAVTSPNPLVTEVYSKTLKKGEKWTQEIEPIGMKGTNKTTIEVSSIPPLNLGKRLEYLIRYPHGCVEQTTSSAFPQLYLKDLMPLSNKRKKEIDKNIKAGLGRLMTFQASDGGMAYWPNQNYSNEWGTNYAGHFMIEAKLAGYSVSSSVMERWKNYQNKKARSWNGGNPNSQLTQAYRLYLLALLGKPELSSMNRMRHNRKLSDLARWYLASAYSLAARPEAVKGLLQGLRVDGVDEGDYKTSYGSSMRNEAILLQALSITKKWDAADKIAASLSKRLNEDNWYSTQSTAFTLVAMAKYSGKSGNGKPVQLEYKIGNDEWTSTTSQQPIWQSTFEGQTSNKVSIKSTGNTLYSKVLLQGIPLVGDNTSASNGLDINVEYYTVEGEQIEVEQLKQGEDFSAQITVKNTNTSYVGELALTYGIPSGWQIHNDRLDGADAVNHFNKPDYQDVRDDRIYFYFGLEGNKKKVFEVRLNASFLGKFYLPTTYVEAMYDNAVNGRKGGYWVEVIK